MTASKARIKTANNWKPVRLGVIGFGRGRGFLTIATREFENVIPAGICDIDSAKKEIAAELFPETPFFDNLTTMLEQAELDALIVETPADYHAEICGEALDAGVHVMSDIPCVDSVSEGEALYAAVKRSKAMYMSGANPNFRTTTEALLDVKAKGWLGKPYYIETEYVHDLRSYFEKTPWRRTYPPIKYCTHSLGPVLELIEEELEWVSCFSTGSHVLEEPGQQDAMSALLRTKSNVVTRLLVSFVNEYHHDGTHFIRIFGTEGSAIIRPVTGEFRLFSRKLHVKHATKPFHSGHAYVDLDVLPVLPNYVDRTGSDRHGGTDCALIDKFLTAIRTDAPSPIPVEKALRMCLPGIYANTSADRGGELTEIHYPWSE